MEWTSQLFAENVCNLLTEGGAETIQNSLSSRSWRSAAAWALEKRSSRTIYLPLCNRTDLEELERNPFNRVTSLVFNIRQECPEAEEELGEVLQFLAHDDDSEIRFGGAELLKDIRKKTFVKVMNLLESNRFRSICFFTSILGFHRVCDASETFFRRHIQRGCLKEVSLLKGWKNVDDRWIKDLLPQKQLIKFNSLPSIGVTFDVHTLNKMLATIAAERPPEGDTRNYKFRPAFGHRLENVMVEAGFRMPDDQHRGRICRNFHRPNIHIFAVHDKTSTFVLTATYGK